MPKATSSTSPTSCTSRATPSRTRTRGTARRRGPARLARVRPACADVADTVSSASRPISTPPARRVVHPATPRALRHPRPRVPRQQVSRRPPGGVRTAPDRVEPRRIRYSASSRIKVAARHQAPPQTPTPTPAGVTRLHPLIHKPHMTALGSRTPRQPEADRLPWPATSACAPPHARPRRGAPPATWPTTTACR